MTAFSSTGSAPTSSGSDTSSAVAISIADFSSTGSGPIGAGAIAWSVTNATNVSVTFENRNGVLQASLSGLKWALFAETTPDLFTTAIAKGIATTDGSGVCAINITGSGLASGVTAGLVVFQGTGATNDPAQIGFIGPVITS